MIDILNSVGYGIIGGFIAGVAMMFLTVAFGAVPALKLHLSGQLSKEKFDGTCRCYTIINWAAAGLGFAAAFLTTL